MLLSLMVEVVKITAVEASAVKVAGVASVVLLLRMMYRHQSC
jgi:hypothetical protein